MEGVRGGNVVTTDGPYAETKEALTGYYLIEAAGVPPQPRAWLTVTARRKAIDILRRERARPGKERNGLRMIELARSDLPPDDVVQDAQLRLIFTCCHPALSPPTRVALALRTLPPSPRWHAVRAELFAREGRYAEAARELAESLDGPATQPERQHRERRRAAFLQLAMPTPPDEREP